jgi:epoxyqueuosine reductase
MVYGCDVCQDVCPWNRAVERRRGAGAPSADSTPTVSLREWLELDGEELVAELDRLYVPRNDPKWLRRNALVAAGNVGTGELVASVEPYASDEDPVLREAAAWALGKIAARTA